MNRILDPDKFRPLIEQFNRDDVEDIVNLVPNAQAWDWLSANAPLFDCPDPAMVEMYYYRWWVYRKHIKQTPAGRIVTEFISDVRHAGSYNSISCAAGFHLAEGRWLRDQSFLDEYTRFWFRGNDGKPEPKFHNYSSWFPSAMWDRSLVTGDTAILIDLLPDLITDYAAWEAEKLLPNGLFWQYDVRDAMEESISGSRKHKNFRPTINSYMYANALAIADIARLAGRKDVVDTFTAKAARLRELIHDHMWDDEAGFFMAQTEEGPLCDAREALGFIPWQFNIPDAGCNVAWKQLTDPEGFWAPYGITTAERRHPRFRTHGVGKCEWDGAVWPFATSQTLYGLGNALRTPPLGTLGGGKGEGSGLGAPSQTQQPNPSPQPSPGVPKGGVYLAAMHTYVKSQRKRGIPYLGEYLDEVTGEWLKGDNPRSRYYNHSTFNDLVITGLIGLQPMREGLVVDPLLPEDAWEWFCVENIPYHGRNVSILWDRYGKRFGRGSGLCVHIDGDDAARSERLSRIDIPKV